MFPTTVNFLAVLHNEQKRPILTLGFGVRIRASFSSRAGANLPSMSDWSQAQPLVCTAATNPTPGQLVTVADPLPDPAVGEGRYYLAASQNGADRRLGRQYVNQAFSAREPAGLPACQ